LIFSFHVSGFLAGGSARIFRFFFLMRFPKLLLAVSPPPLVERLPPFPPDTFPTQVLSKVNCLKVRYGPCGQVSPLPPLSICNRFFLDDFFILSPFIRRRAGSSTMFSLPHAAETIQHLIIAYGPFLLALRGFQPTLPPKHRLALIPLFCFNSPCLGAKKRYGRYEDSDLLFA